jgi:4-hydroxy-tetrahydrodipicolinate synthase
MINHGLQGNSREGYEIHYKMMDIIDYIFEENNPAGIKTVLQELEICKEDVRLPLVKSSSQLKTKIVKFVKSM